MSGQEKLTSLKTLLRLSLASNIWYENLVLQESRITRWHITVLCVPLSWYTLDHGGAVTTYSSTAHQSGENHWRAWRSPSPSWLRGYSSMSFASSSEKSDIELSDDDERSSWKVKRDYNSAVALRFSNLVGLPEGVLCGVLLHVLRHFLLILLRSAIHRLIEYKFCLNSWASRICLTCEGTWLQHPHSMDRWGLGRSATKIHV